MKYSQLHLKDFINDRPALSVKKLEELAKVPENTIRHFLKGRRDLPEKHFNEIQFVLSSYGYKPMNQE